MGVPDDVGCVSPKNRVNSAKAVSVAAAMVSRRLHGTVTGAPGAGRRGRNGCDELEARGPGACALSSVVGAIVFTRMDISSPRVGCGPMVATSDNVAPDFPQTGVVLAATPLGNIGDASPRLRMALERADIIAAEDTRRTRALAAALGVELGARVVSNFDHNEEQRREELLRHARTGVVVVVTDAGMPLVSDPGHAIVAAAHDIGVPVTCIPGPSAVTTALALSGLNVGQFLFDGFAPRKPGAREAWLQSLLYERRAICFFESPHRIAVTLTDAARILGPERRAAVCRELTKTYEEVKRAPLGELAQWAQDGLRGEITVVVEGGQAHQVDPQTLVTEVTRQIAAGQRMKDAVKEVAKRYDVKVGDLYTAVVEKRG